MPASISMTKFDGGDAVSAASSKEGEQMTEKTYVHIPMPSFPWRHVENLDWMEHARCVELGIDPEQFFPRKANSQRQQSNARRVISMACDRCHVAEQCFQYGKDIHATAGVWGGVEFGTRNRSSYGD